MSAAKGRGGSGSADRLEPYRRLRKPVPPPSRLLPDRRRRLRKEQAEREARDAEREASRHRDDRTEDGS